MTGQRLSRAFALFALVALSIGAQQGFYKPYQERVSDGVVDWDEGWIRTEQVVTMRKDVPAAQARVEAQRVATVKAQAAALRLAMRLPVNSDQRLESYEALKVHVRGVVAGGQIVSDGVQANDYRVALLVPVNGVKGIIYEVSKVILPPEPEPERQAPSAKPEPPPVPPAASKPASGSAPPAEAAAFASVTIDATEAGAKPALQPRILDPQGNEVYGVKTVKRVVASEKTLARYVTPAETGGASPSLWLGEDALSRMPLALIEPPSFLFAQREPSGRQRGQDQGLQVKAVSTSGPLKADLVVTAETAKKIRESAQGALSEGKVVVVLRADVGGVESRRRAPGSDTVELASR
jgi:hypothetical protein